MFRLEPQLIQEIATWAVFVTLGFYILQALYHSIKDGSSVRVARFLRYKENDDEGIKSKELNATFMASAFSLASAIYAYVQWSATDKLFALWSPITWTLGVFILYLFSKKIFNESKEAWTLHAYLGKKFNNPKLVKLSSLVTTIVFFLQIAAEVIVGIAVLRVFIGFNISTIQLSIIVGSTFIIYSIIGGLPSVLKTDVLQYRLVLFALIGIVVIAFNEGGATAIKNIYDNKGTFAPHGYEQWLIILSLLAFNLPLLITDMSVWQRISAAKNVNEAKKGSLTFTFSLFVWMSIIVLFTTGFYTFFVDSNETNIVERMISFYSDSIIYPFLIAGFLGALVSTADTFLISSVQTIIVDWQFSKKFNDNNFDTDKFTKKENINIIKWSRLWVLIFGVFSIIIGIISYLYIEKLIYLLFIVFGLQATLAPSVIICLLDKQSKFKSSAPYYSILLGSIVAILGLILSFFNLTFLNISTAYWTPIVVLIVSIIPIILLKQKK